MSLRKPIYAHSLSLTSSPVERYPVAVTLFLVGILIVIALLILGVVRNFRWLFWLLLIATALSALPIPITLLQMTGVLPTADPLWYGLFRMEGAAFEFALAVWMIHIYRHEGVWGLGKQRNEREDTQPYETGRGWSVSMTEKPGKSTIEAPSSSCGEHDAQTQARPQGDTLMKQVAQTKRGPIEYRIVGQGPTLLVLNGGHTNSDSPLGHEQFFLDQGYQLLIPSRPGYGKTPSSTGRTAEAFADALVSLLDFFHLDAVIVVGISAAGPTALQLAGRHPERVSKVILQNAATSGSYASGMIRFGSYVLFNPLSERWVWAAFRGLARVAPQAALKSMLPGLSRLPPDQVLATMSPAQQQAALASLLASRSGSGFLHDIHHHCGDLGRITAPVLIITSNYDGLVDSSHATYAHTHIPQAQLFISEAESHLMWFSSHDDEIRAKMQEFLQS